MSTATPPELHAPTEPVRGRIERGIRSIRRHARTIGLALWGAAGAVFALHASGTAFPDATRFAMLDSWLIGLGCVGCPLMALRDLERRINLQVFAGVALFCAALALLLTALIIGGALRYNTVDDIFALILPLAAAIQPFNAWDGEIHARRREDAAHQRGREDTLTGQMDQTRAALAGLDRLEAMTPDALDAHIEYACAIREAMRREQPLRRLASVVELPGRRGAAANGAHPHGA